MGFNGRGRTVVNQHTQVPRRKNRTTAFALLYILLWVAFTVAGEVLLKQGLLEVGAAPKSLGGILPFLAASMMNIRVLLGLACPIVATVVWLFALSYAQLSFAYPFTGLAIVLVLILSDVVLHESIPLTRWAGIVVVSAGLLLASRGARA